jgi:hypothetical protein
VVSVEDLAKFNYAGDRSRMESDLRNLTRQGLVAQRGTSALQKESRQVLTLTKQGQRLIRRHGFVPEDQTIYSGLVKPKEADHDADLYRLYHKAAGEIARKGGKPKGFRQVGRNSFNVGHNYLALTCPLRRWGCRLL